MGAAMSEYERAMLRLSAWKAVEGWGVTEPIQIGDKEVPIVKPHGWEKREELAERLFKWMIEP